MGLFLAGCAASADGDDLDDEKTATTVAALDVGTAASEVEDLDSLDPAKAASHAASSTKHDCKTKTLDPANPLVVHVTLDGCQGRFGRHAVSGHLTVTFSANPDGSLHTESESRDLTIDGRPFSRKASTDITLSNGVKTMKRRSEKTGTKPNGDDIVQRGEETIIVDGASRCRTINGTRHAVVGGDRDVDTKILDLQTCEREDGTDLCPTGRVESIVSGAKSKTAIKTFDGTPTVRIDITKPKRDTSKTWTLDCEAR
ncbi:MAG: hypothetical protein JST00_19280 [Deltaproteobacteria bacterium]|nr:hypothetical protein [Deltaproteobacteria bacterium]